MKWNQNADFDEQNNEIMPQPNFAGSIISF